jgi:general secretion pathway protein G
MRIGESSMICALRLPSLRNARRNARAAEIVRSAGFTLLELMIVLAIIFILVGLAAGRYEQSVQRAREAALKSDLKVMREAIEQYTLDKQAPPQALEDLVSGQFKYLREIPTDPMTRRKDWQPVFEDVVLGSDQTTTGMTDVRSSSERVSPFEGTPYNTW